MHITYSINLGLGFVAAVIPDSPSNDEDARLTDGDGAVYRVIGRGKGPRNRFGVVRLLCKRET